MSYFKNINISEDIATTGPTKTNLTSSQSYASDWFLSYNQTALQIVSLFDKNVMVYIDQAIDVAGTQIVHTSTYATVANTGLARSVSSIAPYYRVRLVNQSGSTATGDMIAVSTAIFNPLPISTDSNDTLRIGNSTDEMNMRNYNTPQGELRTVEPVRLVGAQFDLSGNAGAVDTSFWTSVVDVTAQPGTIVQASGSVALNSGTNAAAYSKLYSVRRGRYISAHANRFRANIRLGDTGTTNNTRRWGVTYGVTMPTITDGAWFQLSGATFSIVTKRANAADTVVSSGSFNGVLGATYSPTFTDSTTYEIMWYNNKVYFSINGSLLHTVSALATTWSATLSFYVYMDNVNSATLGGSVSLNCRNAAIHRLGPANTRPHWKYTHGVLSAANGVLKYGPGTLHSIANNSNSGTLSLYDALGATNPIALIDLTRILGTQKFDLDFYTGLTIVQTGAASDTTIIYE